MLSGQGWTAIAGCRQFFYARYFDWAVTCSLIVLNLGLIAGADVASIAATMAAEGNHIFGSVANLARDYSTLVLFVTGSLVSCIARAILESNHANLLLCVLKRVFRCSYRCFRWLHGFCCRRHHREVVLVHLLPRVPGVRSLLHRSYLQGQRCRSGRCHCLAVWPARRFDPDQLDLLPGLSLFCFNQS
jgi:hypothetical protein